MAQPKHRKEKLCVIISLRNKVSAEARVPAPKKLPLLAPSPFLFCRSPQTDDLECISSALIASKQGVPLQRPAHRFTTEASSFCSMLHGSFQELSYCMCQPHSSCSCASLEHFCVTVCNFMANHNNRIIRISRVFDVCRVVSLEFLVGQLAIEFVMELGSVVFLIIQLLDGGINEFPLEKLSFRVTPGHPPSISRDCGWDYVTDGPAEVVNSNYE